MEARLIEFKAAVALLLSALGTLLGWRGVLLVVWVAAMGLDYLTGTMAARRCGEWSSAVAREGLWHKGGMIGVVLVAALADGALVIMAMQLPVVGVNWPGLLLPLVLAWYVLTELGSVLENCIKLGAPVPEWLAKGLKITAKALEKTGQDTVSKLDKDKEG